MSKMADPTFTLNLTPEELDIVAKTFLSPNFTIPATIARTIGSVQTKLEALQSVQKDDVDGK